MDATWCCGAAPGPPDRDSYATPGATSIPRIARMCSPDFAPARYHESMKKPPLDFDPDAAITTDTLFGLPFKPEESEVVLIPVPWDATVSYGVGASKGPEAIRRASRQLDI